MISKREDYLYVTGDVDAIEIVGEVLPNSTREPYPLRGEDIAFLIESAVERSMALGYEFLPEFTKRINVGQLWRIAELFSRRQASIHPMVSPGTGYISPTMAIGARYDAEFVGEDLSEVESGRYRSNFPNLSDEEYYPPAPLKANEFASLSRRALEDAFLNQRKLTRCFRAVRRTGGFPLQQATASAGVRKVIGIDGDEFVLGEEMRSAMPVDIACDGWMPVYYRRNLRHFERDETFIQQCEWSYAEMAGAQVLRAEAARVEGLPKEARVIPVSAWRMSQRCGISGAHPWAEDITRYGFYTSRLSSVGIAPDGSYSEPWFDVGDDRPSPIEWRRKSFYVSPPDCTAVPTVSETSGAPHYTYEALDEILVAMIPVGFIITLGDRTKWWA